MRAAAAAQDAASSGVRRLTPAELQELLQEMFIQADADNSGALSPTEFKEVLKMALTSSWHVGDTLVQSA